MSTVKASRGGFIARQAKDRALGTVRLARGERSGHHFTRVGAAPMLTAMSSSTAMSNLTVRELLATHEAVLTELRSRDVVRTNDAPAGQYAEWLAQRVFGGELAPNSEKSYDLTTTEGVRLQVKCRVVRRDDAGERQLSPFRSFGFDQALIVLFGPGYTVRRAVLLSAEVVKQRARWSAHVNGHLLIARDGVLDLGTDVTSQFPS
jgi:hypothetical protein